MLSLLLIRTIWRTRKHPSTFFPQIRSYNTSEKISNPLRILFCGSDDFSVASLRALHAESKETPDLIKSIDILCRPPKPIGRGLKNKQQVPLYHIAKELNLKIHQRDTFLGWDLPTPDGESINLIIAVSFGLFIPPRIIRHAEYGGLNIHPSILPNFRGSAPLQRMIMYGAQRGGITLQTLDTQKFDHGLILAQRRFRIPNPNTITYQELLDIVTPQAAEILIRGLRDRVYVPPLMQVDKGSYENKLPPEKLLRAPKISKEDRNINWHRNDAAIRIDRRHRALGPMWSMLYVHKNTTKRFVFHDFEIVERPIAIKDMALKWKTGRWFMDRDDKMSFNPDYKAKISPMASEDISAFKDAKGNEGSLVAWQTSGTYQDNQTEDQAFASWQATRNNQTTQENREAPKQNVYHMIDDASSGDAVPVFYIEDGSAIIVAVQGAGLRIREITVEGEKRKPAVEAMKMFRKKGMWSLRYKEVEGTDRWFAAFNENYEDTWNKKKRIESLPPDRKEEEEDRDLWFQIREKKRRELALYGPLELRKEAAIKEQQGRAESKLTSKTRMRKVLDGVKERKRAERIEAENRAKEQARIAEDLKKNEWSYLLLGRQREFFPEAFNEVEQERSREGEENQMYRLGGAQNAEEKNPSFTAEDTKATPEQENSQEAKKYSSKEGQ